ncbi:MAG: translocation/assembly module TamB domain-containing protein, partial [Bacteroidaceae bacterium]|nr:translocation/assembly module TamB domain-containing protein [Bacteroidaceae bacterium]
AIDLATRARFEKEGLRFTFHPSQPVLAYQTYNLNDNAYVMLRDDGKVVGNMRLLTDKGEGLVFKAEPTEGKKQDMHLDFINIDLGEITGILPYAPLVSGILNGGIEAEQPIDGPLQANGVLQFKNLAYEGSLMGENMEVALNVEPKDANIYGLVGTLRRNGEFVTTVGGEYNMLTGDLDLETILYRFPAEMVNGFIPDQVAGLRGIMEGNFHIAGSTEAPIINGTLKTSSVYLYSDMYAVNLRLEDKTIDIKDSRLSLRNVNLLSEKNDKMTLNGTIDFSNLEQIMVNLTMRATNFQVFDKPRNTQTIVYGKAYVGANATLSGPLDELKLKGTISLLGTSDVTYVLKDSPLTVEDRLSDLVTFVDFNDTILVSREIARKEISGMDATLTLQIDEGAKVSCDLSNNRESYVDLMGGGTLVLRYTPEGKMALTGRYTIDKGEMKYALPVIPLKTFSLGSGSYVEFTGDVMNPKLNITATEKLRASVSNGEGAGARSVDFVVGVLITNTLNDMG